MITKHDLRIGNILKWKYDKEQSFVVKVESILYFKFANISFLNMMDRFKAPKIVKDIMEIGADLGGNELQPIPLTEQILLDSGFTPIESTVEWQPRFSIQTAGVEFCVILSLIGDSSPIFYTNSLVGKKIPILAHERSYVHNLQNAYRLVTGEELNIIIK